MDLSIEGAARQDHLPQYGSRFFDFHEKPVSMERMWVKTQIKSDRPKVEGNVTPEVFDTILKSVKVTSQIIHVLGSVTVVLGTRELCIIGNQMGIKIGDSIKNGANLIELHFEEGRKHSENPWYSYLGKDACDALRKWFQVRGYPRPDDPYIWPSLKATSKGAPLTEHGVRQLFARITGRLGYTPKTANRRTGQPSWSRYGYSIKELRDLAISLAQRAVGKENDQGEGFLESSTEYFAGHNLDPLQYRKLHKLDADFRKRQYSLVEPFLNVISNPPAAAVSTEAQKRLGQVEIENKALKAKLDSLEGRFETLAKAKFKK